MTGRGISPTSHSFANYSFASSSSAAYTNHPVDPVNLVKKTEVGRQDLQDLQDLPVALGPAKRKASDSFLRIFDRGMPGRGISPTSHSLAKYSFATSS